MNTATRRFFLSVWLFGCCLILCSGCSVESQKTNFIAKVGDEVLTTAEVPFSTDTNSTDRNTQMNLYINSWINESMLYREAVKSGIENDVDYEKQLQDYRRQLAIQKFIEKKIYSSSDTGANDTQLRAFFDEHQDEFTANDNEAQLGIVLFSQRGIANTFRNSVVRGASWQHALDNLKTDPDGVLQITDKIFYTRQTIPSQELWNVALSLHPGDISFPVQLSKGFAVIHVFDIQRKGEASHFDFVRDEIRQRLLVMERRKRYETFLKGLREQYKNDIQFGSSFPVQNSK